MKVIDFIKQSAHILHDHYDVTVKIVSMIEERQKVGYAKYGFTIDRTDLSKSEWQQHFLEELLDGAQYAIRADEHDNALDLLAMAAQLIEKMKL